MKKTTANIKCHNNLDFFSSVTSSMEWMKKQFTKPSYCNVDADKTNGAFGAGTKADEEDGFEEKTDHLPIAVPEKESAPKVSQPEEEYYCTIKMQVQIINGCTIFQVLLKPLIFFLK